MARLTAEIDAVCWALPRSNAWSQFAAMAADCCVEGPGAIFARIQSSSKPQVQCPMFPCVDASKGFRELADPAGTNVGRRSSGRKAQSPGASDCELDHQGRVVAESHDGHIVEHMAPDELAVRVRIGEHVIELVGRGLPVQIRPDVVDVEPSHRVAPAGPLATFEELDARPRDPYTPFE